MAISKFGENKKISKVSKNAEQLVNDLKKAEHTFIKGGNLCEGCELLGSKECEKCNKKH